MSSPEPLAPLAGRFADAGFVRVPSLLYPDEVEPLVQALERLSGRSRRAFEAGDRPSGWTVPDGVTRHEAFWPLITHPRLVELVRTLLGSRDVRFLQHTDLHVGFSSFNWHRDSVSRQLGVGPDWDEAGAAYRIVRVGLYLQATGARAFKLGLVPGTHRLEDPRAVRARRAAERGASWWGHARRALTGRNPDLPGAEWVEAGAGDAVVFDPRVLHTGTPVDGAKYSVFLAYGLPNRHFAHHRQYYRHARADLGYGDVPPELAERLRVAGLLYEDAGEPVLRDEDATRPSAVESLFMRARRAR